MKRFLDGRSKRWGHDGWALKYKRAPQPITWTVCTTRAEARQLRREFLAEYHDVSTEVDIEVDIEVVKIRLKVQVVDSTEGAAE